MSTLFESLFHHGAALYYIDEIILMSNSKSLMLQLVKQLQDVANGKNLKLAAEFFFLLDGIKRNKFL